MTAARAACLRALVAMVTGAVVSASTLAAPAADAGEGQIVTSVDRARSPGSTATPPRDVLVVRLANRTSLARRDAELLLFRDRDHDGHYDAAADRLLLRHELRTPVAPGTTGMEIVPVEGVIVERVDGAWLVARMDRAAAVHSSTANARASAPGVACCAKRGLTALALDEQALSTAVPVVNQMGQSARWTTDAGHVAADAGGGLVLLHGDGEAFDIELRLMFPRGATNDAGILFGFRDARHWYQLRIDERRIRLMRVRGEHMHTLASGAVDIRPGRWTALRAEVRRLRLTGFVDDRQALTYDGPVDTRGAVGVMQDGGVRVRYAGIVQTPHHAAGSPRGHATTR